MSAPTINWPTKPGHYIVHNETEVVRNEIRSIWRIAEIVNPADGEGLGGYWSGRWYPDGLYVVNGGGQLQSIQSYFTMDGKPWDALAFHGPLNLPLIASAYEAAQS